MIWRFLPFLFIHINLAVGWEPIVQYDEPFPHHQSSDLFGRLIAATHPRLPPFFGGGWNDLGDPLADVWILASNTLSSFQRLTQLDLDMIQSHNYQNSLSLYWQDRPAIVSAYSTDGFLNIRLQETNGTWTTQQAFTSTQSEVLMAIALDQLFFIFFNDHWFCKSGDDDSLQNFGYFTYPQGCSDPFPFTDGTNAYLLCQSEYIGPRLLQLIQCTNYASGQLSLPTPDGFQGMVPDCYWTNIITDSQTAFYFSWNTVLWRYTLDRSDNSSSLERSNHTLGIDWEDLVRLTCFSYQGLNYMFGSDSNGLGTNKNLIIWSDDSWNFPTSTSTSTSDVTSDMSCLPRFPTAQYCLGTSTAVFGNFSCSDGSFQVEPEDELIISGNFNLKVDAVLIFKIVKDGNFIGISNGNFYVDGDVVGNATIQLEISQDVPPGNYISQIIYSRGTIFSTFNLNLQLENSTCQTATVQAQYADQKFFAKIEISKCNFQVESQLENQLEMPTIVALSAAAGFILIASAVAMTFFILKINLKCQRSLPYQQRQDSS
eukprot:TRINITY_DN2109_c0_g1_i1.p1 TRINITY_DN2109_c0_g1~~TRINITY_DN2109_c0_g1_i1.p1  ORF type:complete len:542 (-),score=176.25 TRINITY_DN2109_c0_g1_i1:55-1680(-)